MIGKRPRQIADGLWLVAGGLPVPTMNVYLIEDEGGGVTMFDAGVRSMVDQLRVGCEQLGGLNRIVLGHGHVDHRGAAPGLEAPVYCHPDNVADTEGDGGRSYQDLDKLGFPGRAVYPTLMGAWDGGPVEVAGTVAEGDDIGGFTVVSLAGHAPGQIGLLRERDGVALTSDCFYTINPLTGIKGKPRLPHAAFNQDEDAARSALLKLAELAPRAAWPGHADPISEGLTRELLRVARAS